MRAVDAAVPPRDLRAITFGGMAPGREVQDGAAGKVQGPARAGPFATAALQGLVARITNLLTNLLLWRPRLLR